MRAWHSGCWAAGCKGACCLIGFSLTVSSPTVLSFHSLPDCRTTRLCPVGLGGPAWPPCPLCLAPPQHPAQTAPAWQRTRCTASSASLTHLWWWRLKQVGPTAAAAQPQVAARPWSLAVAAPRSWAVATHPLNRAAGRKRAVHHRRRRNSSSRVTANRVVMEAEAAGSRAAHRQRLAAQVAPHLRMHPPQHQSHSQAQLSRRRCRCSHPRPPLVASKPSSQQPVTMCSTQIR